MSSLSRLRARFERVVIQTAQLVLGGDDPAAFPTPQPLGCGDPFELAALLEVVEADARMPPRRRGEAGFEDVAGDELEAFGRSGGAGCREPPSRRARGAAAES
jgi:hypothetical protein